MLLQTLPSPPVRNLFASNAEKVREIVSALTAARFPPPRQTVPAITDVDIITTTTALVDGLTPRLKPMMMTLTPTPPGKSGTKVLILTPHSANLSSTPSLMTKVLLSGRVCTDSRSIPTRHTITPPPKPQTMGRKIQIIPDWSG